MFGIIYVTVNKINGKKYIGQHKCSDENDNYLGSGKALRRAVDKYGKENFERYTLYRAETKEELAQKEIDFIAAFNATHRKDYYNINEGGNVNRMCGENNPNYGKRGDLCPTSGKNHWNYGKHWSDEAKKKISESHKGKPSWNKGIAMREESKAKLSKANTGKERTDEARQHMREAQLGRKHSKETKQKIADANRRYHEQGKRRIGKPVICIETGIVYASGYDAERAIGCGKGSMSSCLAGSCKTLKGYHWRYATKEEAVSVVVV